MTDDATTYPPLATLAEMPLHSGRVDFDEPGAFGCELGEDPGEGNTLTDWRCPGCVAHAEARVGLFGDTEQLWYPEPGAKGQIVKVSWLIARARYWGVGT